MIARSSGELAVLPLSCAADQKPALILSVIHFLHNFPPCQRLVSSFISLYVSSALALQGCAFDSWLTQCRISHSLGIFFSRQGYRRKLGKNETGKKTLNACWAWSCCTWRSRERRTIRKRSIRSEPSFFKRSEGEMKRRVRVFERGRGRKGERQRLPQLVQSAGSR